MGTWRVTAEKKRTETNHIGFGSGTGNFEAVPVPVPKAGTRFQCSPLVGVCDSESSRSHDRGLGSGGRWLNWM